MYMEVNEAVLESLRNRYPPYTDFSTYGGSLLVKNRKDLTIESIKDSIIVNGLIKVDDCRFQRLIINGFSAVECNSDNSWRWSDGYTSEWALPLNNNVSYLMTIRCKPFKNNETQNMAIFINDIQIVMFSLDSINFKDYHVDILKEVLRDDNIMTIKYKYATAPCEINKNSDDCRKLGVSYAFIKFEVIKP